ncbi:hypothetical protein SAMN05660420_00691 [Desulfuromusa kysingii]|uniref:Uncharacterized protein n=1 Tax=Desulfuromusa kysingii TaxID=37625 RepID=A0A1H3WVI3_9BACT|nr:hypothetical protein [Desulfuromusa kysingii]SDZ90980.1 hypothetical protein SAMN05660420_00691 [Desulfuromusa kysingii]
MTVTEIKTSLMELSIEDKKAFIIETLPELAKDVIKEPGFMMQLFPVLLDILKESGMDMQQLLQLATMMSAQQNQQ